MWIRRVVLLIFLGCFACSSIPWNSVDGLDEGEDFVRLPVKTIQPEPQVYTAIEGESVLISEPKAGKELSFGRLLVEIRTGGCTPCDALEKTLTEMGAEEISGTRRVRLEVQSDDEKARIRTNIAPTLILLDQGVERVRLLGNRSEKEVRRFLEENGFRR